MESIRTNVDQVCADFQGIKEKIVANGVEVADGTPTSEYAGKVDEVFEAGKEAEYQAWWDSISMKGTRVGWVYGIAYQDFSLVYDGFNPPYQLKPTGYSPYMFSNCKGVGVITAEQVDFSECTNLQAMFMKCEVEEIELIDATNVTNFSSMFNESTIKRVKKFILNDDGSQSFTESSFGYTSTLEEISFEGVIGNNIWFSQASKLTRDSMLGKPATAEQIAEGKNLFTVNGSVYYGGIFGALKNFVKEDLGNTATIKLNATSKANLTDEEKLVVTETLGWTIA